MLKRYTLVPLGEMLTTLLKKREGNLRFLLHIMLLAYGLYWFSYSEGELTYLYLLQIFPGFTGSDFALFAQFSTIIGKINLVF